MDGEGIGCGKSGNGDGGGDELKETDEELLGAGR